MAEMKQSGQKAAPMPKGPGRRGPMGPKPKIKNPGKLFLRLMKYVFKDYGLHYVLVILFILISVFANIQGTLFTQTLIDEYITPFLLTENPDFSPLAKAIGRVACFYAIGILANFAYNRIMINVTHGRFAEPA